LVYDGGTMKIPVGAAFCFGLLAGIFTIILKPELANPGMRETGSSPIVRAILCMLIFGVVAAVLAQVASMVSNRRR
jgi:hypothetical protein